MLISYVFIRSAFETGKLSGHGWVSLGGGLVFLLIIAVGVAGSATTLGLSNKSNGSAFLYTIVAVLALSLLAHLMLDAGKTDEASKFMTYAGLLIVLGVVVNIYGFYILHKASETPQEDPKDDAGAKKHYGWSKITLAIGALGLLITMVGAITIYRSLS